MPGSPAPVAGSPYMKTIADAFVAQFGTS